MTRQEFISLFTINNEAYGIQDETGNYRSVKEKLTPALFDQHLKGSVTLGTYTTNPKDNKAKFTVIDVDIFDKEEVNRIVSKCHSIGISDPLVEFSGRKGFHIYIPYSEPIPAWKALNLGLLITENCQEPHEIFPKQDYISEDRLGNLIKIPLGIHRASGKRSKFINENFVPIPIKELQVDYISEKTLDIMLKDFSRVVPLKTISNKTTTAYPCNEKMYLGIDKDKTPYIGRNTIAFHLSARLFKHMIPRSTADTILSEWNSKNNPPLSQEELDSCITQGYSGRYGSGCQNDIIQKVYCEKEKCNFYNKINSKTESIDFDAEDLVPKRGFIKDYVNYAIQRNEAPLQYHLLMALQIINTIIEKKVWFIGPSGQKIYSNIYSLFLGGSGVGKSTAIDTGLKILHEVCPQLVLPSDYASREAMLSRMAVFPTGSLVFGELEELLAKAKKDGHQGLLPVLTYLFDCPDDYEVPARSVEPIFIDGPKISLVSGCTPDGVTSYIKESDIKNGFFARFAVVYSDKKSQWTMKIETEEMREDLKKLISHARYYKNHTPTQEADFSQVIHILNDYYKDTFDEISDSPYAPLLTGFYARFNVYVIKYSILYQIAYDGTSKITEEAVYDAIKMTDYLKKTIKFVVGDLLSFSKLQKDLTRIKQVIYSKGYTGVNKKELLKISKLTSREMVPILETLLDRGEVEAKSIGKETIFCKVA